MAEVVSQELGRPVAYHRMRVKDFASTLRGGAGDQTVEDISDMLAAQDDGVCGSDWAVATPTLTDLRTWWRDVLLPAVERRSA
jgi:hypothetical protein